MGEFSVLMTDSQIDKLLKEEGLDISKRPMGDQVRRVIERMVKREVVTALIDRVNECLDKMELPEQSLIEKTLAVLRLR